MRRLTTTLQLFISPVKSSVKLSFSNQNNDFAPWTNLFLWHCCNKDSPTKLLWIELIQRIPYSSHVSRPWFRIYSCWFNRLHQWSWLTCHKSNIKENEVNFLDAIEIFTLKLSIFSNPGYNIMTSKNFRWFSNGLELIKGVILFPVRTFLLKISFALHLCVQHFSLSLDLSFTHSLGGFRRTAEWRRTRRGRRTSARWAASRRRRHHSGSCCPT